MLALGRCKLLSNASCCKDASWKCKCDAGRTQAVIALEKMQVAGPGNMQVVSTGSCWNERWLCVGAGSGVGAVLAWRGSNKVGQHIPGMYSSVSCVGANPSHRYASHKSVEILFFSSNITVVASFTP